MMMMTFSFSSFLIKTYAAMAYVVVFWVLGLAVQHYQAGVLLFQSKQQDDTALNPSFWDNFGLSCISNVLMGSLYVVVYMGDIAVRKFYYHRPQRAAAEPQQQQQQQQEPVFCVEEEEEEEEDVEEAQQQQQPRPITIDLPPSSLSAPAEESIVLRITPGRLWYYMYTTGWGFFCMAYTLHGAHWVSSLCLCAGSLFCALWGALREKQVNSTGKRVVTAFLVALNVGSVCICTSLLVDKRQSLLWRSWVVEIACPLLTPFWLWESKDKMLPMNMPKQSMVMFGLPFTSMISAGYLSMYIPLQGGLQYEPHLQKNATHMATPLMWTPLVTEERLLSQSVWGLLLCGVVVPALTYTGFVLYASGFQKVDMQMLCANSLWMVFAMRLWMYAGNAYGTAAAMALLGWFAALLFVLLHHFETDSCSRREWQDVYGDILLEDEPGTSSLR